MKSGSYVLAILRHLARSGALSAGEIGGLLLDEFIEARERRQRGERGGLQLRPSWDSATEIAEGIEPVLDELQEIGVIRRVEDGLIVLNSSPPEPPGERPAGERGDDPGDGLGEVLAHRILFSYDEQAFEDVLERALRRFDNE